MRFVLRRTRSMLDLYTCVYVCSCGSKLLHACTDMGGVYVCMYVGVFLSTSGSEIQIRVSLKSSLPRLHETFPKKQTSSKAQSSPFSFWFWLQRNVLIVLNFKIFFVAVYKEAANLKFTLHFFSIVSF